MKKIKGLLLVAVLSFVLFTSNVFAKDKVKVYIFEAGGCPYCEAEVEYLKKLDSYNEKFKMVQKELYVDHINWEQGKDYELGVKVAEAFLAKGYQNASYQGTPFVVIGNRYAAAAYSEDLESVINEAYEAQDDDIVECFEDGKSNCSDKIADYKEPTTTTNNKTDDTKKDDKEENDSNSITAVIVLIVIVAAVAVLLILARGKMKSSEEKPKKEEKTEKEEKVEEKEEPKKSTTKKTTTKKPTTKKTTKKTKK